MRIAIAGNIIDDGAAEHYELQATLARVLEQPFAIDGLNRLRQALSGAATILYLADNAGETVFDRVLIETIGLPVTYVVKAGPAINDANYETLSEIRAPVFFLLQAKCRVIADDLGVPIGSVVLKAPLG